MSMLVTRTAEVGVENAVRTTFDGGHPCNLCLAVKQGQKTEQEKESSGLIMSELAKVELILPANVSMEEPVVSEFEYPVCVFNGVSRSLAPPKQPPRLA